METSEINEMNRLPRAERVYRQPTKREKGENIFAKSSYTQSKTSDLNARGDILATHERRSYYRINYPVALEYHAVDMETILASEQPKQFNVSPYFTLQLQLAELETEMSQILTRVSDTQPHVANALDLLNRKVELIGRTLAVGDLLLEDAHIVEANISESGMSFTSNESLSEKSFLALKLIFPNDALGLLLYSEVVRCEAKEEGFEVSINFMKMPESCRSILARTLMRAQMRQLRLEALDREDEDLRH